MCCFRVNPHRIHLDFLEYKRSRLLWAYDSLFQGLLNINQVTFFYICKSVVDLSSVPIQARSIDSLKLPLAVSFLFQLIHQK